jgi:hypothetical protein
MTHYRGQRDKHGVCFVWRIDGTRKRPLRIRLDLENHSPTGFNWGYGGSGPAQLAVALLADATGNDLQAVELHQEFKRLRIAPIADDEWELTREEILDVAAHLQTVGQSR